MMHKHIVEGIYICVGVCVCVLRSVGGPPQVHMSRKSDWVHTDMRVISEV